MNGELWDSITNVAARQYGAISVDQLRGCGVTWRVRASAEAAGLLSFVEPRVAVVHGSPETWLRRLHAGALALDGRGWVSHRSAGRLLSLDRFVGNEVEFTVPRAARGLRLMNVGVLHYTDRVGRLDVVTVKGFRCSSATRTILDLANAGVHEHQIAAVDRWLYAPAQRRCDGSGRRAGQARTALEASGAGLATSPGSVPQSGCRPSHT